ncbi:MAG: VCBS repeat-containing protein, partial [Planctomycetes bacterium]|nr:VCBS repeat-containing protein [Planctomycetota bacterium]
MRGRRKQTRRRPARQAAGKRRPCGKLLLETLEDRRMLAVAEFDFGDAPAPYATLLADDGPRHELIGPTLGASADAEADGQPSSAADGDGSDEDGVTFGEIRVGQLDAGVTVNVQIAPAGAKLDAWIDFNGDGSWGGPGEHIFASASVINGDNALEFDVPSWAISGNTFARFRLSTAGDLGPGGLAADGEVEDYQIAIDPPTPASGLFGGQQIISTDVDGVRSVFAVDVDGDGDIDVLSVSSEDERNGKIAWYENDGNAGFTAHTISTTNYAANSVFAADVDGDGDIDVLSASSDNRYNGKIAWHENDGSENFTTHTIVGDVRLSRSVFAADIDGDGDTDVLGAAIPSGLAWYENDGSERFTAHVVSDDVVVFDSVYAVDVDGDGDIDVIGAVGFHDRIVWYENDGDEGFTDHVISTDADSPVSVFAADIDGDGDVDVLSTSRYDGKVTWYENDGREGFTTHVISTDTEWPMSVFAADMDGDGDLDVLSASGRSGDVAWYENNGHGSSTALEPFGAETKLIASDGRLRDEFGRSVGISGNTAIVGIPRDDDAATNSGSAYLYDVTTGNELFKLTAPDAAAGDEFGWSVGISGNRAIVGARADDDAGSHSGSAYLFDVTTGKQLFKLTASDAAESDVFGWSVGISGNVAIVGAFQNDDAGPDSGSAYLFDVTTGEELFKLKASDAAEDDLFGSSVAISGNTAIVGAYQHNDDGNFSGSAYLFDVTTGEELFKLTASDVRRRADFGWSVAISGNTAIVGAPSDHDVRRNSGSVHLFNVTTGAELFKLKASDVSSRAEFGYSVGISGEVVIVGARRGNGDTASNSGSAYLFDVTSGEELFKLAAIRAAEGDSFGFSVGFSGNSAIVGAPGRDDAGDASGSAYLFTDPTPPSDLTGNKFVDFNDLTILLSNWNQDVGADEGNFVDATNTPVNFDDLTVLLADWTGPDPSTMSGFTAHTIDTRAPGAIGMFAADMDGDGDLDVLSTSRGRRIVWYENFQSVDLGDAPAPYPTLRSAAGAFHAARGPTLGALRDGEDDGQPTDLADGDGDDDDGVTIGAIHAGQLNASLNVNVQNAPQGARLDAWIDFDGDGVWDEPEEHIFDNLPLDNGDHA